ncbi:MAG: ester cyclase [Edaphobacter sp.]
MSLTRSEMDRAVDEHFKYEAEDDIEGVLSTLATDATHDIVGWPAGPTQGRENARPFYAALFADLTESGTTTVKRLYGEDFVVDESIVEFKAVGRPYGLEGKGRTVRTRLLHVIEFATDGMIQRENAWIDMAAMMQQLPPGE